jgi:ubiquinone/menaquinone biosynthesis C-methylase UbiE
MADHSTSAMPNTSQSNDKPLIAQGYDRMAEQYTAWAVSNPSARLRYLDDLLSQLPSNSTILELGCGAGTPVLEAITQHASCSKVFANDISTKQVELARKRCLNATFFPGDMMALDFEAESLDGVAAFYSILHLPRDEQRTMFAKIARWMKPGGVLTFNLGAAAQEEMRGDFFGEQMFWSGFDAETSRKMVQEVGLEILKSEVLVDGYLNADDPDYDVRFLWVVAKKPAVVESG